jgi:hypothetical protein
MKNKGIVYILLVVVGIIWYQVFFRIKDNFFEEVILPPKNEIREKYIPLFHRDTFQLNADYRDPFRGVSSVTEEIKPQELNTQVNSSPKVIPAQPKPHHWPKIKYFGLLKSNPTKGSLCIVQVGNSMYNLREGEVTQDNIEVRRITRDSIILAQGKFGKVIKKQP